MSSIIASVSRLVQQSGHVKQIVHRQYAREFPFIGKHDGIVERLFLPGQRAIDQFLRVDGYVRDERRRVHLQRDRTLSVQ
jgi:hypothetical protein